MIFKTTEEDYYLLVNRIELYQKARLLRYHNVVLLKESLLEEEDLHYLKEQNKCIVYMFYDYPCLAPLLEQLEKEDIPYYGNNFPKVHLHWVGKDIESLEQAIEHFPSKQDLEPTLVERGYIRDTDYTNRCGNCHEYLGKDDKYCSNCGTKRGEGAFNPVFNPMYCVYGPPTLTKLKCEYCGHKWTNYGVVAKKFNFCPNCGKGKPSILETKVDSSFDYLEEWENN